MLNLGLTLSHPVVHIYVAVGYLLVLWRVVALLRISKASRVTVAVLLLPISQYHLLSRLLFGNMFSPELPFPVVAVMGWLFGSFALLVAFTVLVGLIDGVSLLLRWRAPPQARHLVCNVSIAAALVLGAVGLGQAIRVPDVHEVDLPIKGLPPELDGFELVQLSDLHISKLFPRSWVEQVVRRVNNLSADLIVVTGDLIDGTPAARAADVAPLKALRAQHGVLAIPGNHEYYFDHRSWTAEFERLGIPMLENSHRVVEAQGRAQLVIAGVTDPVAASYGGASPDLAIALKGAPSGTPVILLSHRPEGAEHNAVAGVALQLSGHTHGGMVKGIDVLIGPANQGFVSRLYQVGGMSLYVSNGTGLWMGFPLRLGVPSEITKFVLRRAN